MSRTFVLRRDEDETGVSGTGDVAYGCEFPNGKVALTWAHGVSSCTWFDELAHVEKIHGHGGSTRIVFDADDRIEAAIAILRGDTPELVDPERTCPECGQECTTVGGLRVHQTRSHGAVPAGNPLEPYFTSTAGDGRSRPWRCHCGAEGKGGGGLRAHLESHDRQPAIGGLAKPVHIDLVAEEQRDADLTDEAQRRSLVDRIEADEPTDDEIAAAMRVPGGKHRFTGPHRSTKEDTSLGAKRVHCECGWVTLPFPKREEARDAFHLHIDEMQDARRALGEMA